MVGVWVGVGSTAGGSSSLTWTWIMLRAFWAIDSGSRPASLSWLSLESWWNHFSGMPMRCMFCVLSCKLFAASSTHVP